MRIDSHQHFWRYDPVRYDWIRDEMAAIRRDFQPSDLRGELIANGIDGSVAVQAEQSEEETLLLLDLARENEFIRGVVGWVDLLAENCIERLQYFAGFEKLRGFRHVVQAEPDDHFMLREDFLRGIASLRQFDFSYDILIYPRQLPAAIRLVEKYPDQAFVLDHIAKPLIKDQVMGAWEQQIRELAGNHNVCCKLSGMITEADWHNWRADDFKRYLDVVFEAFGPSRLMFGSDWPVCLVAGRYGEVKELVEDYTHGLSPDEKEQVFGLNAVRFYGLRV